MKWDLLTNFPCLLPPAEPPCVTSNPTGNPDPPIPCCEQEDYAASNPTICLANADPRCDDPSFAQDNPSICPNSSRLILKPSYFLAEPLQQVTYQAFLLANGQETLLSSNVVFSSSNGAIAQIGGSTGKCSTVGAGICAISATWQGVTAYGQLEVISDCAEHETDFVVLIDDSASMGTKFSDLFQSKVAFAKNAAMTFVDTIDLTKDRVAVFSFADATQQRIGLSQDSAAIKAAIQTIPPTSKTTNLRDSLNTVIGYLDSALLGPGNTKCIVLFTDGENKTGGNPLPDAAAFEAGGNIILIVGCRAYNGGFALLEAMASGGFFINAYQNDQGSIAAWLSGLKSYICSGNCTPPGDKTVYEGALDYAGFINWDVGGKVDLLGNTDADPKYALFDFLPGNGLYVDMCGSSNPFIGSLISKAAHSPHVDAGSNYAFSLYVAGNQRENRAADILTVKVSVNGVDQMNGTIQVDDWLQGFKKYTFNFQATQTGTAIMLVSTIQNPGVQYYGLLVDVVDLTNTDTSTQLFHDTFDTEHPFYIPPNCANNPPVTPGHTPVWNYPPCYASGCLDMPVPAQVPDPFPTTDVEDCNLTGLLAVNPKSKKVTLTSGGGLGDSSGLLGGGAGDESVLGA